MNAESINQFGEKKKERKELGNKEKGTREKAYQRIEVEIVMFH
jgi:hypothetical protein